MFRNFRFAAALLAVVALAPAQERRSRIDVEHYVIDAEINQRTQSLTAKAQVRFVPLEDNTNSATFELNNALNVSKVTDDKGKQIPATRYQQDFTVRLSFDQPLPKGTPVNVTFEYDGRLNGSEDSPVYGIRFAAIHDDYAFLMYPARWFPISWYTTDPDSPELNITVAQGSAVVTNGVETSRPNGAKVTYNFTFDR